MPRTRQIRDQARVVERSILLDRHAIARGQNGMRIVPHQRHEPSPHGALSLQSGHLLVLALAQFRKHRRGIGRKTLARQLPLAAEGPPRAPEQGVDHQADAGQHQKQQHPSHGCCGRLFSCTMKILVSSA